MPDDLPVSHPEAEAHLGRLRRIAGVLDDLVPVPGTRMRFGVDPLLGLIPGAGDAVGAGVASYALFVAVKLGAPPHVLVRMAGNVLVDALAGTVPLVGDLLDFGWKASRKNVRLVERYAATPERVKASSRVVLWALIAAMMAGVAGVVWIGVSALRWVFTQM